MLSRSWLGRKHFWVNPGPSTLAQIQNPPSSNPRNPSVPSAWEGCTLGPGQGRLLSGAEAVGVIWSRAETRGAKARCKERHPISGAAIESSPLMGL